MAFQQLLTAAGRHFAAARPLMPMYLHLIVSALFPIYTGAHASLSRPSSAAKPANKDTISDTEDEDKEEDVVQKMEGLSPQDAVVFPVTAGLVLAGLYFLIKRYGADLINLILGWYFSGVGVYSVAKLANDVASVLFSFLLPTFFGRQGKLWKADNSKRKAIIQDGTSVTTSSPAPLLWNMRPSDSFNTIWSLRAALTRKYTTKAYIHNVVDFKANLTLVNAVSAATGITAIAYANLIAKPWWLTNLQGFAVCYSALQIMSPTTFATGSLILSGLFCYDIWAVFFTPLMVTVAKNLDQPIKLVFPRPDEPSATPGEPPIKSFSMLGLGDIVLPGIMIGLALRFDLYMLYLKKQQKRKATQTTSEGREEEVDVVEKAPYVPVTGLWGDRFWTSRLPASARPEKLRASFQKPYFVASMVGYVIGMLMTLGVMTVFQHAQPALLYLVPGVVISLWSTGLVRGELKEMWEFSEAITGDQLEEDEKLKAEKKGEEQKDDRWSFGRLWSELFGAGEKKTITEEGTKTSNESEEGKHAPKADDGSAKAESGDCDVLVSFSVARYNPHAGIVAPDENSPPGSKDTEKLAVPADRSHTPSDSGMSEDTVFVQSDEA